MATETAYPSSAAGSSGVLHTPRPMSPGGESVESFNAVLQSPYEVNDMPVGRTIVLEVGSHGLSLRDPMGALLKVVPIEYITGWKKAPDGNLFTIVISKDLKVFYKMQLTGVDGDAIGAAITRVGIERVEKGEVTPPVSYGRFSSFGGIFRGSLTRPPSHLNASHLTASQLTASQLATSTEGDQGVARVSHKIDI